MELSNDFSYDEFIVVSVLLIMYAVKNLCLSIIIFFEKVERNNGKFCHFWAITPVISRLTVFTKRTIVLKC